METIKKGSHLNGTHEFRARLKEFIDKWESSFPSRDDKNTPDDQLINAILDADAGILTHDHAGQKANT